MLNYLRGLLSAVSGGLVWWLSLFIAYFFQIAAFSDYARIRDAINTHQSVVVMPADIPLWLLVVPFLIWVIARIAHIEAMRHIRAARIIFSDPYVSSGPLYGTIIRNGKPAKEVLLHFDMAKVNVSNRPYKLDDGRDVVEAWAEIDVVDLHSKPVATWQYPRWEENKQPGYADHPLDHYPDSENVRTLAANGKPHILCIVYKPLNDDVAYPLRGADQLKPGWRSDDITLPKGQYLVRVRISGKGLQEPAEKTFMLEHGGTGACLQISPTNQQIQRYWPR